MDIVTQAKMYATRKHVLENHQLYAEILPYTHHLAAVEAVLIRYGYTDGYMCAAAWLHDVVEDVPGVKIRNIEELFGEEVALLVGAVTSEEGANRKIRNALTYPKIRAAGTDAIVLKLADRIANVEYGGRGVTTYVREYGEFKHGLGYPGSAVDATRSMWHCLDAILDGQ